MLGNVCVESLFETEEGEICETEEVGTGETEEGGTGETEEGGTGKTEEGRTGETEEGGTGETEEGGTGKTEEGGTGETLGPGKFLQPVAGCRLSVDPSTGASSNSESELMVTSSGSLTTPLAIVSSSESETISTWWKLFL